MRREAETEAAAMGVWGVGLYSGDFAMDLRSTIGMVARLPFETEKLVEIVRAQELAAANDSSDEDHTTFWLVMADQLRKKGLKSELAFSAALEIIDSNRDLEMMRDRGMSERDLKKRRTQLQHLRAQLLEPLPQTKRTIMKKPQPYVMDAGDVIVYPTCEGTPHQRRSLNEEGKLVIRSYMEPRWDKAPPWRRDGWSAFVVVERGRAFDFFAWYTPVVLMSAQTEKPTPDTLLSDNLEWEFARSGTCSAQKFQLLEFERIANWEIDAQKMSAIDLAFDEARNERARELGINPKHAPRLPANSVSGRSAAMNDVSINDSLRVRRSPDEPTVGERVTRLPGRPQFAGIEHVLKRPPAASS